MPFVVAKVNEAMADANTAMQASTLNYKAKEVLKLREIVK